MYQKTLATCLSGFAIFLALVTTSLATEQKPSDAKAKTRSFLFDYGATLENIPTGANVRVWLPVPQTTDQQKIETLSQHLPAKASVATEPTYGNKILHFELQTPTSGELTFKTSYKVLRKETRGLSPSGEKTKLDEQQRKQFLSANNMVPLEGKQLDLLAGEKFSRDSLATARSLYNRVDQHVRYDKSQQGYGNGDVLWVCDSRFGNCTDFHSLFISLARAQGIPSRFEIGFPLPPQRGEGKIGGYHCWALFHNEKLGWVPVDISEADKHPEMKEYYFGNLTEDRITFTTGRDIKLVPQQAGEPLNYFIYPHVEVDGKPLTSDNITMQFHYRDL